MIYKIIPRSYISGLGKKWFTKSFLALTFLGSGKNDLQNHFFLLYYPKQRFLMSSREVTKTQKYMKFFKNGIIYFKEVLLWEPIAVK